MRRVRVPRQDNAANLIGADRRVWVAASTERLERHRRDGRQIGHTWCAAREADEVEPTRYHVSFDLEACIIGQHARIIERISATGRAQAKHGDTACERVE